MGGKWGGHNKLDRIERCCKVCGAVFWVPSSHLARIYCSQKCFRKDRKRKPFTISNGYVFLRMNGQYINRAKMVMEQQLGRSLKPGEVVHHVNGDKQDDRPENLQLFANRSEHVRFHHQDRGRKKQC